MAALESAWRTQFDGAARRSVESVIDLDSDERECPACFARYRAGPVECPECGLFIGG